MAQIHFSDEVLMAFADGELDEHVAATVEQAMASDPAIAKQITEFLRSRRLVRSAFPGETASGVPPELRAAVQAQIDRFEGPSHRQASLQSEAVRSSRFAERWSPGMSLAASVAIFAAATAGYLAGRDRLQPPSDPVAHLAAPEVGRALGESLSGQEQDLPFGRIRVISTFRIADGSLCREFKLRSASETSSAVACHANGWVITFALVSTTATDTYIPSGGADLMANYLQNAGAGEPLSDAAEIQALSEAARRR